MNNLLKMKSLKHSYIQNNLKSCMSINKEQKFISLFSKQISEDEYFINININKNYFKSKIENKRDIDTDLLFVLHLTHNFPTNSPRLFCLTSLSHIGIELCDGKDILEEILGKKWKNQVTSRDIILEIPKYIQQCLENKYNKLFVGKYILEYEYDYNMLSKVPNHYFNFVEQIINKKSGKTEKRLLMITSLFFLLFEYKIGYFNYNEVKLVFWASIKSIYGINHDESTFDFEFSKTLKERIYINLITKEGEKIMNIVLYILKERGIDYMMINRGKSFNKSNILPGFDMVHNDENIKNENINNNNLNDNIINENNNINNKNKNKEEEHEDINNKKANEMDNLK